MSTTIIVPPKDKPTIITTPEELAAYWEYICESCGQLRLWPSEVRPSMCGACGCRRLTIGRPGKLDKAAPAKVPAKKEEKQVSEVVREIHLEERPTSFKQVVGQRAACEQLMALGKSKEGLPHCILFTGPSGCGKTTLARIVRRKLECSDIDFFEVNAADNRGIDMVRNIQGRVNLAPIDGKARVWLIDECHQLTPDAQGAFLKLLEEPPNHAYFMLATTHPDKLRAAIRTRCTEITVTSLTEAEIVTLVKRVAADREVALTADVAAKLGEVSEGSARKALVLFQQIIGIEEEEKQLDILSKADVKAAAFEIARALISGGGWAKVAPLIKECKEDPESIRWLVMSYFTTVALGGGKNAAKAVAIIEEFENNYFDTKRAGLVVSCFRACNL